MLPLLVTLPGPGSTPSNAPQAIEVKVLHAAAPGVAAEAIVNPATTAALPEAKEAPAPIEATQVAPDGEVEAEPAGPDDRPAGPDYSPSTDTVALPSAPQDASEPAKAEAAKDERAKDQGPLQGAGPESTPPTEATEETSPEADASNITSAGPEVKEAATPQPEVVVAPSPALSETQSASDELHEAAPHNKPAPRVQARAKAAPAALKRHPVANAKQGAPPSRRFVKARVPTPAKQVVPLFRGIFGRPSNRPATAAPRQRPATTQSTTQR